MVTRRTIPAQADPAPARPYKSTLREQQAADTRRRIVTVAGKLFTERGFAATTVPLIAEQAGVSQPTVYGVFGSKSGIVAELTYLLEDDADAAGWRSRIETEPDPLRKLDLFACWCRTLYATGRGLIAAIQSARGEPGIAELHAQGDANRRDWLSGVIAALADSGLLHHDLDTFEATDRAWMLTGFELYFRATDGCDWSDDAYEHWLADLLHDQLCTPQAQES